MATVVLEGKEGSWPGTLKGEAGVGLTDLPLLLLAVMVVLWAFVARMEGRSEREGGRGRKGWCERRKIVMDRLPYAGKAGRRDRCK